MKNFPPPRSNYKNSQKKFDIDVKKSGKFFYIMK